MDEAYVKKLFECSCFLIAIITNFLPKGLQECEKMWMCESVKKMNSVEENRC